MNLLEYSLVIFFFFYLANYATGFAGRLEYLFYEYGEAIDSFWNYAISCAFCSTFWVSLGVYFVGGIPLYYVFSAPLVNLFINLVYKNLTEDDKEKESYGTKLAAEVRAECNLMTQREREEATKRAMEIINAGKN